MIKRTHAIAPVDAAAAVVPHRLADAQVLVRWGAAMRRWRNVSACLAALVMLGGCPSTSDENNQQQGPAAGVGGTGTGGFSVTVGRIEGFGSIIVAGNEREDRDAVVTYEVDPLAPQPVPLTALRLGMQATLAGEVGRVAQIRVAPLVVGRVQATDTSTRRMRVAEQIIQIDAAPADTTLFEGFDRIEDLGADDAVEVYGQRDADGIIRASFVALRVGTDPVRVTGTVSASNPALGTFVLHGLKVDYRAATLRPAGMVPANGQQVVAYGPRLPDNDDDPLAAVAVVTVEPALQDGAAATVGGWVSRVDAAGNAVVAGTPVATTGAQFVGGTATDFTPGRLVRIQGAMSAGTVQATEVVFVDPAVPATARISSAISEYVGVDGFKVLGTAVGATAAAFGGVTPANLANGVRVDVRAPARGSLLMATALSTVRAGVGEAATYVGSVLGFAAADQRFRLDGLASSFRLAPNVNFVSGTLAGFVNGQRVDLRGVVEQAGGDVVVREVRILAGAPMLNLSGVAGNVARGAGTGAFDIDTTTIRWTASTQFLGATNTAADLVAGRFVLVQAIQVGNTVQATQVDARPTLAGVARVRGVVSDVVSPTNFRIAGQRIDASKASFRPAGLAASLANAPYVEATGQMIDGVLVVTSVADLP